MIELNYIEDERVAARHLAKLHDHLSKRPARPLVLDTETSDLTRRRVLRLVQLEGADGVPVLLDAERTSTALSDFLVGFLSLSNPITAHNAVFDLYTLERALCPKLQQELYNAERVHDTLIAAKIAELDKSAALKEVVVRHKIQEPRLLVDLEGHMKRSGVTWDTVPLTDPHYQDYAALDIHLQAKVWEWAKQRGLFDNKTVQLETLISWLYAEMQDTGIRIDLPRLHMMRATLEDQRAKLNLELAKRHVGNVQSQSQLARAMLADGIELHEKTKTGKPKIDKHVLEKARTKSKVAWLAIDHKANTKLDALLANIEENTDEGICRANIRPIGAITTRSSVSNPPLQQMPKSNSEVRSVIQAAPEHTLVSIDYSQVELRILAEASQEPKMLRAFRDGADLHSLTAETLFRTSEAKARQVAKTLNFAIIYGAGPKLIAKQAGITEQDARITLDNWFAHYTTAADWIERVHQYARKNGRINIMPGLTVPVPRDKAYIATNYIIQGSAAQLLKQKAVELHKHRLWGFARMVIHDEVLFEFPQHLAPSYTDTAMRLMEHSTEDIHYPVESKTHGESWT